MIIEANLSGDNRAMAVALIHYKMRCTSLYATRYLLVYVKEPLAVT